MRVGLAPVLSQAPAQPTVSLTLGRSRRRVTRPALLTGIGVLVLPASGGAGITSALASAAPFRFSRHFSSPFCLKIVAKDATPCRVSIKQFRSTGQPLRFECGNAASEPIFPPPRCLFALPFYLPGVNCLLLTAKARIFRTVSWEHRNSFAASRRLLFGEHTTSKIACSAFVRISFRRIF